MNNQKSWQVWYSIKDWFKNLFKDEGEALLNTYENDLPPEIGVQPYTGQIENGDD